MRIASIAGFAMLLLLLHSFAFCQDTISLFDKASALPDKFLQTVSKKAESLEQKIISNTEKTLKKLEKQELKLKKRLARKDSLAALNVFGNVKERYSLLANELKTKGKNISRYKEYLPGFDSLKTSLNFLSNNTEHFLPNQRKEIQTVLEKVNGLDTKLQGADAVRKFLKERRQLLKTQLERFGLLKKFQKYNKQAYYYSQQIQEYKNILQDQSKAERLALRMISKVPAFSQFFQKHSELATLFPTPSNYGTSQSLQGLQARVDVQQLMQRQLSSGGPNAAQFLQQSIQQAQQQVQKLKEKINEVGGSNSDFDMPDFKPNTQKTKSFFKRLEFGTNIQNAKRNYLLPTTSEVGISIGYKINDKSVIGIGSSYKIGFNGKINHLTITNEGIGLRSFLDWKLKGQFFLSGGYEQVYYRRFQNISQIKIDQWQHSALIGITRKYRIGKKWKGNFQLLFDALYKQNIPQGQPIKFRFGYGF